MRIEAGQRALLGVPGDGDLRWLPTQVEAVVSGIVWVAWATDRLALVRLHPGDEVMLAQTLTGDARYYVPATVVALSVGTGVQPLRGEPEVLAQRVAIGGNLPLMALRPSGEWTRQQDRTHVRIDVGRIPVEVARRSGNGATVTSMRLVNLSAGGALMEGPAQLELDEEVICCFQLEGIGKLALPARVVRADSGAQDQRGLSAVRTGVEFHQLKSVDQERISRWVLAEQLRRRRLEAAR